MLQSSVHYLAMSKESTCKMAVDSSALRATTVARQTSLAESFVAPSRRATPMEPMALASKGYQASVAFEVRAALF